MSTLLENTALEYAIAELIQVKQCYVDTDDHAQQVYLRARQLGLPVRATKTPTVGWLIELTPNDTRPAVEQEEASIAAG